MAAPGSGERVEEDDEKDVDVGRGDDDLEEDLEEEIEEDPEEEEFEEDPDEEEFEDEEEYEEVEVEEEEDAEEVGEVAGDEEPEEVEEGGGGDDDEEGGAEEVREVDVDEETEHVEEEEEEEEVEEDEDVSEEEVSGDDELQGEDEEEVEEDEEEVKEDEEEVGEDQVDALDEDEDASGEEAGVDEELHGEDEEEVEEDEVDESDEDEDVNEEEEFDVDVDKDLQCEEKDEREEEEKAAHNEEDGANEEVVEHVKSLTPPISSEKDTTGLRHISLLGKNCDSAPTADVSRTGSQIGYKTETGGLGDEIEDTENRKPPIFAEAEALKNEKVDCPSRGEGVKEMKSDYAEKETSQDINKIEAEDINLSAVRNESISFEATKPLSTNPPIYVEAGATDNEKVDHASEGEGLKKMESDCEEKERSQHVNKKDAEDVDVCARSSESKGTEIAKPFSTVDTKIVMCENSELVLIHEGGVEDMDLDSEENFVHGSDIDGTVVDSIQENTALNSHHEVSFKTGADALSSRTVVAESLKSLSSRRTDKMLNNEPNQDDGGRYMNLDLKNCTTQEPSSMVATSIKKRSSSPCTELMDRNKRPAVICDYYAKGWCIKGNSCRFLHVKENKDNINKQQGKDPASANGQNQVGEGIGDETKHTFPEQHAESHIRKLNNNLGYSSVDSRFLHSLRPEFGCELVASSSVFSSRSRPSSIVSVTEAIDYRRSQQLFSDPLQSIANRYIKQHLHPSSATDMYTSRYISPVNGSSNSIISLNSNPFDVPKVLSGTIDFNASSKSLGSRAQRDPLNSHGVTLKAEMYKWEPSKPFRPSYYFSIPSLTSPGSMYDPLRDSIEQTSLGIGSFKAELIHYPSHQQYPESASAYAGNHFEIDGYNGTKLDRNGHSRVTGLPVAEAEAAESSVADQGNLGSAPEKDKGSGTSRGKHLSETNKTKAGSAAKKRKTVDEKVHSSGVDVDRGLYEDEQRESKTFRQFRVALIDFIKELLKPAWREGNLSKDAHNLIVKKAADKVLSSLHSHLVPSTPELVQQYLSASQPKISKLVEAYVQKHSKT
ncbi:unnamed protein product [Rhodiola kirilowii]